MKRAPIVLAAVCLLVASAAAQEKPPPSQPSNADAIERPSPPQQIANVRIDITITDTAATPVTRTLTLVSATNSKALIRNEGMFNFPEGGRQQIGLSVDATPSLVDGNRVFLGLTLSYRPPDTDRPQSGDSRIWLNESVRVFLDSGKPLVVSQSADPTGDRKVTLEVKATILR